MTDQATLIARLRDCQYAWQAEKLVDEAADTIESLRAALVELVACKRLADQFDAMKENVPDFATAAVLEGTQAEYLRRKPAAWAAAFALVDGERAIGK